MPARQLPVLLGLLTLVPAMSWAGEGEYQAGDRHDAMTLVKEATAVVQQMQTDHDLYRLMNQAKGIFLVPDYGRAALVVGGSGGRGVMLARNGGDWSNPVFYNIGSVSFGAQAGASAGAVAMLLMTDEAVDSFKQENNFSLNAGAGISILDWSAAAGESVGKGDVVLWTDTEGAYAGATVSVTDIMLDEDENGTYYGEDVSPAAIIEGSAPTRQMVFTEPIEMLRDELSS